MDLFGYDPAVNLLPCDGTVNYHGPVLDPGGAQRYYEALLDHVPWKNDEVIVFGKHHVTARKVAWYGDSGLAYRYSGTTKPALPWTAALLELKAIVEHLSHARFNSCLLNLYHHGGEGMGWHSDDEKSMVRHSAIASLSLGAERDFRFKHKRLPATAASVRLENGSLLVMKDATQSHWLHSIPQSKKILTPRINLTFRYMVGSGE
jgi:alkylated DNA repair dioxygenase AlkB